MCINRDLITPIFTLELIIYCIFLRGHVLTSWPCVPEVARLRLVRDLKRGPSGLKPLEYLRILAAPSGREDVNYCTTAGC